MILYLLLAILNLNSLEKKFKKGLGWGYKHLLSIDYIPVKDQETPKSSVVMTNGSAEENMTLILKAKEKSDFVDVKLFKSLESFKLR